MYFCEKCKYETNKKDHYNRHCNTIKHKKLCNEYIECQFECVNCDKKYKHLSGLKYHEKKCKSSKKINELDMKLMVEKALHDHSNEIISLFEREENKEITKLKSELREKQNEIDRLIPLIGNKTNNFNLNIFLNDKCKDALNWDDFVKQLIFTFNEDKSITDDISNIICSSIDALGLYKRPIHCIDLKRKKLCIKNGDEWDKQPIDILKKTTESVQNKYKHVLDEWEEMHPNWYEHDHESVKFLQLTKKYGDPIDFERCMNKIMKASTVPKNKLVTN
jgi:hypothetical protein